MIRHSRSRSESAKGETTLIRHRSISYRVDPYGIYENHYLKHRVSVHSPSLMSKRAHRDTEMRQTDLNHLVQQIG